MAFVDVEVANGSSSQQLVQRDGQISDARAGCMVDGIRNRRGDANDADLADALRAEGVDDLVLLLDEDLRLIRAFVHVQRHGLGAGGDHDVATLRARERRERVEEERSSRLPRAPERR